MGVTTDMRAADPASALITKFIASSTTPYSAVFAPLGRGNHYFGQIEFKTMDELARELRDLVRIYRIEPAKLEVTVTRKAATFQFEDKATRNAFMTAAYGKHVQQTPYAAQIANPSGQSKESASQFLEQVNTGISLSEPQSYMIPAPGYMGNIRTYVFPDLPTLRDFCQMAENPNSYLGAGHPQHNTAGKAAPSV